MEPYTSQEHEIFREQFRRFCGKEIAPLVEEAERTQTFPRHLFPLMGQMGYLCVRYPEEYGGAEADKVTEVILREELSRVCQGIASSWSGHSHLATYPIFRLGSEEQRQKYLVPAIKGEKIGSFALTEPDAGSDTKSLRATATRQDGGYLIRGSKTFITNAPIADYFLVAAYTDKSLGYHGISLFLVDGDTPGISVHKLDKEGIRSSDTGEVSFDDCLVGADALLGGKEGNFNLIMETLSEGRVGGGGQHGGRGPGGLRGGLALCQGKGAVRQAHWQVPGGEPHAGRHGHPDPGRAAHGVFSRAPHRPEQALHPGGQHLQALRLRGGGAIGARRHSDSGRIWHYERVSRVPLLARRPGIHHWGRHFRDSTQHNRQTDRPLDRALITRIFHEGWVASDNESVFMGSL